LKTNVFELAPQEVITKDNVSMSIKAMVYYRAVNAYKLVYKLRNDSGRIREFIKEMSYAAMRSVVG
jgi:regulator of protease activity HflC (stomatin/prohibitin superfamily)